MNQLHEQQEVLETRAGCRGRLKVGPKTIAVVAVIGMLAAASVAVVARSDVRRLRTALISERAAKAYLRPPDREVDVPRLSFPEWKAELRRRPADQIEAAEAFLRVLPENLPPHATAFGRFILGGTKQGEWSVVPYGNGRATVTLVLANGGTTPMDANVVRFVDGEPRPCGANADRFRVRSDGSGGAFDPLM